MSCIKTDKVDNISIVTINRGKVNAINEELVNKLIKILKQQENDNKCRSVILTGNGSFFSFGFDIPELLSYKKQEFLNYLYKFNQLVKYLFLYPKPVVISVNGHCIAGGCVVALTGDYRVMVNEKSKIAINEITFGSTFFSSALEILKYVTGHRNAEKVIFSGTMFDAQQALEIGLVDETCSKEVLFERSLAVARDYTQKDENAFYSLKKMARSDTLDNINTYEDDSLMEFVDIWYSEKTWKNLKKIEIRK